MDFTCTFCGSDVAVEEDLTNNVPDTYVAIIACDNTTDCGAVWNGNGKVVRAGRVPEDWTPPADAPRTKAGELKHTCAYAPSGPPFGNLKLTENDDCARCAERRHGAPSRRPEWAERLGSTARRAAQDAEERRRHFAPGGPHATGRCGPVCTAFDW